jgi:hypothetical protein
MLPVVTSRKLLLACFLFSLIGMLGPARSELVLNSFTASKPMKIMPIGDSITDDCSLNGAWRSLLATDA